MALLIGIDWERIFDKYGWPTSVLLVVVIVFKQAIWPRITKYLDNQEKVAEDARQTIIKRAEKLEQREETQLASFTDALDGLKDVMETSSHRQETQIAMMEETLRVARETNGIVKESKRR